MKTTLHQITGTFLLLFLSITAIGQDYTFEDFVGTWHGTISSQTFGGYNDPITMTIEPDGFYTETSGHLMPTIYPNTQQCEYQASTNRFHWWYLGTVWGGQYFYDHFYYEVVYFENGVLEMHYNFWDDPEPYPEVGTIYLVKEGATVMPPPETLSYQWMEDYLMLNWNEPDPGNGQLAGLEGYNIYHETESMDFELIDFVETNSFTHMGMFEAGLHSYYVTAVYEEGESDPSDDINVLFLTPSPESLEGMYINNGVELMWEAPEPGNSPMATLSGYNIHHQIPNGAYELVDFTNEMMFMHEDSFAAGLHTYYVTAVYEGGESGTSNMLTMDFLTPEPTELAGMIRDNMVELTWSAPDPGDEAMATLEGYNVYHMPENGSWEMLANVVTNSYIHENLEIAGTHNYYVTAVYNGGESDPSNEAQVVYQVTGIFDEPTVATTIYPNPASDFMNISSEISIQSFKILNQAGQVTISENINTNNYRADLRKLQQGVYILVIETNKGSKSELIVVK